MGNFAENLNLGNRFRPPLTDHKSERAPSFWVRQKWIIFVLWYGYNTCDMNYR